MKTSRSLTASARPNPKVEVELLCGRVRQRRVSGALSLPGRNLTDAELRPLLDALEENAGVTRLDLRRNRIGLEGW